MEARHDLRKFITELPVAERGAVLSSGREVLVPSRLGREIAQRGGMKTLHQDSLLKVKEGLSTVEEAFTTVPPDM